LFCKIHLQGRSVSNASL